MAIHGLAACMSSKQPSWSSWSSWLPTSIRMGCSCVSRCQNQVCFGDDQGGDFASLLTRCGGSNPRSSTHHQHTSFSLYNIGWNLSQAIGHVCEECGSILTGELFTLHGRVLCEADFKVRMMVLLVLIVILSLLCWSLYRFTCLLIPLCQALELAECGACSRFRQHQDHLVVIVIIISIIIIIIFCSPVATSRSPPPTHSQLVESLSTMAACSVWCVPMLLWLILSLLSWSSPL